MVQPSAAALLEPIQLAQSRGGCERAIHLLQASLECKSEDSAILSVDFSNAFNTLRRDVMLQRTFSEPQLSPLWRLVHWAYRSSTDLLLVRSGEIVDTILSAGLRQGSPFLLCCSASLVFLVILLRLPVPLVCVQLLLETISTFQVLPLVFCPLSIT